MEVHFWAIMLEKVERLTSNSRVPHMARGLDVSEQLNKSLDTCECFFYNCACKEGPLENLWI